MKDKRCNKNYFYYLTFEYFFGHHKCNKISGGKKKNLKKLKYLHFGFLIVMFFITDRPNDF